MMLHWDKTLASLSDPWPRNLMPSICSEFLQRQERTLVVLDDDPTGTQTVYDLPVLTEWSVAALAREFQAGVPVFYVLTNSRSLDEADARALAIEAGRNLSAASEKTGREFSVISRSDSTLRGHFPAEVNALAETMGMTSAVRVIIPCFPEGGRVTIDDVHYVRDGDELIPAAETPFARDDVFGYRSSNLKEWVAEKSGGVLTAGSVKSVSLEDIRKGGPEQVADRLMQCPPGGVCVVNAVSYRDIEVLTLGLLKSESQGRQFLCRTGAAYVRVRAGLAEKPLLQNSDLPLESGNGGLIVVGSYVPKSTLQLEHLITHSSSRTIEVHVDLVLSEDHRSEEVGRANLLMEAALKRGQNVVLYTSRRLVTGGNSEESLAIGHRISETLVRIVRGCAVRPRFIVAKGGITASDLATRAFDVRRAWVMGQIQPGVPVWQLGDETTVTGMVYIVFPGNVGTEDSLTDIVRQLG